MSDPDPKTGTAAKPDDKAAAPHATVTLRQNGRAVPRRVDFTVGRLLRIESATGRGFAQIAMEDFAALSVAGDGLTDEQRGRQVMSKLRLSTVAAFVSGCLDVPEDELGGALPTRELLQAFYALATPFLAAVSQLLGGDEAEENAGGDGARPPEAPAPAPA